MSSVRLASSVKVTAPVAAVPVFGPVVIVTVAVNVTAWSNTEGFGDGVAPCVVSAATTSWSTEPLLVASPVTAS